MLCLILVFKNILSFFICIEPKSSDNILQYNISITFKNVLTQNTVLPIDFNLKIHRKYCCI